MSLLHFITAIPWDVYRGSGCYIGTRTLIQALRQLGIDAALITPKIPTPMFTATRVLFNESLRWRRFTGDATVGIDADGYSVAQRRRMRAPSPQRNSLILRGARSALPPFCADALGAGKANGLPHIACIKGVLADAVRFERGFTRTSMAFQARLEATHARNADLVITVSQYCAQQLAELYGVKNAVVVPELIDLNAWRRIFAANPAIPDPHKFTVHSVCRFYPRKRLDLLVQAAALLRDRVPHLELRIVGGGPEYQRLRQLSSELGVEPAVRWLGDVGLNDLAAEYNRCDVFCLPSVQEGFGIVFLEAMAAEKPIVAARAAAVPEVVRSGLLVEPENSEALAEAILRLYRDPALRKSLTVTALREVEQFEMRRVATRFLEEVAKIVPAIRI